MGGHDIADSDDLGVLLVEEIAHVALTLRPQANAADNNALAGGDAARSAEHGTGSQNRVSGGSECQASGLFEEISSG